MISWEARSERKLYFHTTGHLAVVVGLPGVDDGGVGNSMFRIVLHRIKDSKSWACSEWSLLQSSSGFCGRVLVSRLPVPLWSLLRSSSSVLSELSHVMSGCGGCTWSGLVSAAGWGPTDLEVKLWKTCSKTKLFQLFELFKEQRMNHAEIRNAACYLGQ